MTSDARAAADYRVAGDFHVAVIVQSRLGSTRLPEKGLLPLGGEPVIAHVLRRMRTVPAQNYVLATDHASFDRLAPVARKTGFEPFAGDPSDVLARFCAVIARFAEKDGEPPDIIVRATGDNPFLFADAAAQSVGRFKSLSADAERTGEKPVAYFTYTGLPHGSGVEILHVPSLLAAASKTTDPYDHEHVGPALYRHQDEFRCVFEPAPAPWNHPELRTTIDTFGDYRAALRALAFAEAGHLDLSDSQAVTALFAEDRIRFPVLCVPVLTPENGTGHLRRALSIAKALSCDLYAPAGIPAELERLIDASGIPSALRLTELSHGAELTHLEKPLYSLVVTDHFKLPPELQSALSRLGPVLAIDEGADNTDFADYLLDIIPSLMTRPVNFTNPGFIPLPAHTRESGGLPPVLSLLSAGTVASAASPVQSSASGELPFKNVLVAIGGQDPANVGPLLADTLRGLGYRVTLAGRENPIPDLREKLYAYDLVVTHYGFTAFEATAAGCAVLTVATTPLHEQLSKNLGYVCLSRGFPLAGAGTTTGSGTAPDTGALAEELSQELAALLAEPQKLLASSFLSRVNAARELSAPFQYSGSGAGQGSDLPAFVREVSRGVRRPCPVCQNRSAQDPVVFRGFDRTIRRCASCGMLYLGWARHAESHYQKEYFFEEYKTQYGKTYLEDFDAIKAQGHRRASIIRKLLGSAPGAGRAPRAVPASSSGKGVPKAIPACDVQKPPTVLDIGCAYGPFLKAAQETGFIPFGTDISADAVRYVSETLGFPACVSAFPAFDTAAFGSAGSADSSAMPPVFNAVTMWYVIEHFSDLDAVLKKVSSLLAPGGVFAFSTPNAEGVSGKTSPSSFFAKSPLDHLSLWEYRRCRAVLEKYGFAVKKRVSTGHHPERFSRARAARQEQKNPAQNPVNPGILRSKWLLFWSKLAHLGDTFEVYCVKLR